MNKMKGKFANVTGAGRGIGRSVALLLAEEGATVVVNDLGSTVDGSDSSQLPAEQVVQEIRSTGGKAEANFESVSRFDSAAKIVKAAIDNFGRVDILCNAAGILRDRMIFNMTEEEWDSVLGVHLYGAFNMVRNCVPYMIGQRYGRIVLFSSSSGLGSTGQANYASAKEGLVGFTRSLAMELAEHGITVNAVYPGASTRMMGTVSESVRIKLKKEIQDGVDVAPTGPMEMIASLEPEEALLPENNAPKIVFLCTAKGGDLTGRVVGTSGWSMSLYSPRRIVKSINKDGRWTLDELEQLVPISLAGSLINPVSRNLNSEIR